jgi:hypothetical protein
MHNFLKCTKANESLDVLPQARKVLKFSTIWLKGLKLNKFSVVNETSQGGWKWVPRVTSPTPLCSNASHSPVISHQIPDRKYRSSAIYLPARQIVLPCSQARPCLVL